MDAKVQRWYNVIFVLPMNDIDNYGYKCNGSPDLAKRHSGCKRIGKTLVLCFSWPIVRRALISAAIVGTILTFINHGDALFHGTIDNTTLFQIILTVLVPYTVSTISSVLTISSMKKNIRDN
jgi:hypothetical protein